MGFIQIKIISSFLGTLEPEEIVLADYSLGVGDLSEPKFADVGKIITNFDDVKVRFTLEDAETLKTIFQQFSIKIYKAGTPTVIAEVTPDNPTYEWIISSASENPIDFQLVMQILTEQEVTIKVTIEFFR